MRDFNHVMDRVEREIEEIMSEKKWTPKHAEALEELLACEKCIKEIEKYAHAKKRMMGLPAPTEEEDEEMMAKPWHFGMYERGGNGRGRGNYERNRYDYYENDNYERNNYHYPPYKMPPMDYHYSPYMEEDMWDPMMRRKMPPVHMYGGNQYTYGWDPMMDEKERLYGQKMRRRRKDSYDDDDEEEERKHKENYEHNANSVGTPSTASTSSSGPATAAPKTR